MAEFMVCNKWPLHIDDKYLKDTGERASARPYFQFAIDKPKDVAHEAWCYEWLMQYVGSSGVMSVFEYFGGMGMTATIIHRMLRPMWHGVNDKDPNSVEHLSGCQWLQVVHPYNVYDISWLSQDKLGIDADMICADFNSYTIHQLHQSTKIKCILDNIMALGPNYIILTDTAVSRLHLNGIIYSKRYNGGRPVSTIEEYVMCADTIYDRLYNHQVYAAAYHRNACYMLLGWHRSGISKTIPVQEAPPEADTCFRRIYAS